MLNYISYDHEYSLVADHDSQLDENKKQNVRTKWYRSSVRLPICLLISSLQFLLWVVTILYFVQSNSGKRVGYQSLDLHSAKFQGYYPAIEAVLNYETVFEQEDIYWTMQGLPTKETDAAWEKLLGSRDGVIQASYSAGFDIKRLPVTVHATNEPSQHMYGLEVLHQLHCLVSYSMLA
ncbi:hypothetical protein NA57DRAFT_50889 [Rhizodiscina lignyota]|uniref:Uncharacterized protein n=1 Tax=Rhizodiscina lignyota TaxID=1504668 RepID=A0A9P4IRH4_9PEZI|nr:hypothetical protein NA57DRAFT_50889 [Rhizodiscina lignyota]